MTFRAGNEIGRSRTDFHAGRIIIPHRLSSQTYRISDPAGSG